MKKFMDKDFMLSNETAKKLYHDFAADMPIFDYHCHLSPQMMYEDKPFDNITQIFLGGDHYKWRYMRSCGLMKIYDRRCSRPGKVQSFLQGFAVRHRQSALSLDPS